MKIGVVKLFVSAFILVMVAGCQKQEGSGKTGEIAVRFLHFADGNPIVFDDMIYTNKAGNRYEVSEIQWFVSDLTLHMKNGHVIVPDQDIQAHYIDTDLVETQLWKIAERIPEGTYDAISITFGIKGEKNTPYRFTDSPESEMIWPINLGGDHGGYHYMKLNGFWISDAEERTPFNFHLGVGQERDDNGKITGFVQNWFEVTIPDSGFIIDKGDQKVINLVMNVEQWFNGPNVYNHNIHGAKIMQNQQAMGMGAENGKSGVFTISSIDQTQGFDAL